VGRFLGVLTLTPYDDWRRAHAIHHANSGHLDRRGVGDIDTLTVREFQALAFWGRVRYRLYRHPLVMFGLGAAYQFLLRHRLPIDLKHGGWQAWVSAMATNLSIALVVITLVWFVGIGPFLIVHLPITLLAGSMGVWLFYVQHQFEQTFWAHGGEWSFYEASLRGSSHYDLPRILRRAQFRPWHAIGVIHPDSAPPHNLNREVIEASITSDGFQLWGGHVQRSRPCPLWVKSGHLQCNRPCPLYTQ
jgi:omega-6 fatty acid desaturase (delta-12 desaturase)